MRARIWNKNETTVENTRRWWRTLLDTLSICEIESAIRISRTLGGDRARSIPLSFGYGGVLVPRELSGDRVLSTPVTWHDTVGESKGELILRTLGGDRTRSTPVFCSTRSEFRITYSECWLSGSEIGSWLANESLYSENHVFLYPLGVSFPSEGVATTDGRECREFWSERYGNSISDVAVALGGARPFPARFSTQSRQREPTRLAQTDGAWWQRFGILNPC